MVEPILYRETNDPVVVASFSVDGEPMSKARARVVNGHAYTPEGTRVAEAGVAVAFQQAAPRHRPLPLGGETAYGVAAVFYHYTRQRRDVDNMLKLICDALNGLAWSDDTQVLEVSGRKILVEKGRQHTDVLIYEVPGGGYLTAKCAHCGEEMRTFKSWSQINRYCSAECRDASRSRASCKSCGQPFRDGLNKRKYCSDECKQNACRVVAPCVVCGVSVERFRSFAKGRAFCTSEHRADFWRAQRATHARGTCSSCGGSTSRREYARCRACFISTRAA